MTSSAFDLSALTAALGDKPLIEKLQILGRTAENAERYDDLCQIVKSLVEAHLEASTPLTSNERTSFSLAYKNVVGDLRAAWRQVEAGTSQEDFRAVYKKQLEEELRVVCEEALALLKRLVQSVEDSTDMEARVFYLKMAGDYYRYLAEIITSEPSYPKEAGEFYRAGLEIAEKDLHPGDPVRLGLALNFCVFVKEIEGDTEQAIKRANLAFHAAIAQLDELDENTYENSTLIMQLLRDNATLWEMGDESDREDAGEGAASKPEE